MSTDASGEDLDRQLDSNADEIRDYVEKNSPRPSVDADLTDRFLEEAPPAEAAEELQKMVDGFRSGAGAASGRNSLPAADDPPTDNLDPP
jgi:hypothetical protein